MAVFFFLSWQTVAGFSVQLVHSSRTTLYFSSTCWSCGVGGSEERGPPERIIPKHSFGPGSLSTLYTYKLACLAEAINQKCETSNCRFQSRQTNSLFSNQTASFAEIASSVNGKMTRRTTHYQYTVCIYTTLRTYRRLFRVSRLQPLQSMLVCARKT